MCVTPWCCEAATILNSIQRLVELMLRFRTEGSGSTECSSALDGCDCDAQKSLHCALGVWCPVPRRLCTPNKQTPPLADVTSPLNQTKLEGKRAEVFTHSTRGTDRTRSMNSVPSAEDLGEEQLSARTPAEALADRQELLWPGHAGCPQGAWMCTRTPEKPKQQQWCWRSKPQIAVAKPEGNQSPSLTHVVALQSPPLFFLPLQDLTLQDLM